MGRIFVVSQAGARLPMVVIIVMPSRPIMIVLKFRLTLMLPMISLVVSPDIGMNIPLPGPGGVFGVLLVSFVWVFTKDWIILLDTSVVSIMPSEVAMVTRDRDSNANWVLIFLFGAPIAFRTPISRLLSLTIIVIIKKMIAEAVISEPMNDMKEMFFTPSKLFMASCVVSDEDVIRIC